MEDNQFNPKNIQINQGQTVSFENNGKTSKWPASNIHPTHAIYPEFDPKKGIKPGEVWEFKFDKSGKWRYHDHLNPEITGEIIVKSANDGVAEDQPKESLNIKLTEFLLNLYYKIFPQALEDKLSQADLNKAEMMDDQDLKFLLKFAGTEKVLAKLLKDSKEGLAWDCHQQAHIIGRTAFEVFGKSVFSTSFYNCHSGYIHGAMEAFIKQNSDIDLKKKVIDLCNQFDTSFSKFECLHGIGHGILAYYDYDLPESLNFCKALGDEFSQASCYGGAFMENIMTAIGKGAGGHQTSWVSDDPYFPCNKVDQEDNQLQTQCYLMQTSRMLKLEDYDFQKVSNLCIKVPQNQIFTCFQSLGRDAAGYVLRDPLKINEICLKVPDHQYEYCIKGAVNVIIDFWGSNISDKPYTLCKIISSEHKIACYQDISIRLMGIFNDISLIKNSCLNAEKDYQSLCLQKSQF